MDLVQSLNEVQSKFDAPNNTAQPSQFSEFMLLYHVQTLSYPFLLFVVVVSGLIVVDGASGASNEAICLFVA